MSVKLTPGVVPRRRRLIMAISPMVVDCDRLALEVTAFTQALLEPGGLLGVSVSRPGMQKTNNWHLLSACGEQAAIITPRSFRYASDKPSF
jgi:hypothetical protein